MNHPLVTQLWFARAEFKRCLEGVSAEDGIRRLEPMNCISWIVGHLASQEHYLWVELAQGLNIEPDLHALVGYGAPPSTPPLEEMWAAWRRITSTADKFLVTITPDTVTNSLVQKKDRTFEDVGSSLLRNIYHYWFHTGEAHAIRQMLGHGELPQFVGDISKVRYGRDKETVYET